MRVQDHFHCSGKKSYDNTLQIITLVFYESQKIPVLHEEQELLLNVEEVSDTQETMDELELVKDESKTKDSTTLASTETERLRLTEKLVKSPEEIKSLTEERDNLKMVKEALQGEQEQLKEDFREALAKVSFILSSYLSVS